MKDKKQRTHCVLTISLIIALVVVGLMGTIPSPIQKAAASDGTKLTYVETYSGVEIYRWNNYYTTLFGMAVISPSKEKLKNFMILLRSKNAIIDEELLRNSKETYRGYRIGQTVMRSRETGDIIIEDVWFGDNIRRSGATSSTDVITFEKETLTDIIDKWDSFMSAVMASEGEIGTHPTSNPVDTYTSNPFQSKSTPIPAPKTPAFEMVAALIGIILVSLAIRRAKK